MATKEESQEESQEEYAERLKRAIALYIERARDDRAVPGQWVFNGEAVVWVSSERLACCDAPKIHPSRYNTDAWLEHCKTYKHIAQLCHVKATDIARHFNPIPTKQKKAKMKSGLKGL